MTSQKDHTHARARKRFNLDFDSTEYSTVLIISWAHIACSHAAATCGSSIAGQRCGGPKVRTLNPEILEPQCHDLEPRMWIPSNQNPDFAYTQVYSHAVQWAHICTPRNL